MFFALLVQLNPEGGAVAEGVGGAADHCGAHVPAVQAERAQRRGRVHPTHHEDHRTAALTAAEVGNTLSYKAR